MSDTQWPRFQVFLQEEADSPHQDVGSVHAPDAELALQNARDVFVRRPSCLSLWVVPASAVYSRTAEEIHRQGLEPEEKNQGEKENYLVFNKARPAGTQTFFRQVSACSPAQALRLALESVRTPRPPFAWWVIPERMIIQSNPEDNDSLFAPALDKPFRLSTDFKVVSAMRQIRSAREAEPAQAEKNLPDQEVDSGS